MEKTRRITLFSLLLVIFLDGLGQGLFFPILIRALIDPSSTVLVTTQSPQVRNLLYGLVIGVYFLCWLVSAPILGDLSDKIGRKKTLLICLFGMGLGYLFSIFAFLLHNITLLFVGRILSGITAGDQPIVQASIVDLSDEKERGKNLGIMFFVFSSGIIGGPLVGGFFSETHILSFFNDKTPLMIAFFLSVISFLLICFFFQETYSPDKRGQIKWGKIWRIFSTAFAHRTVRRFSLVFLFFQIGWTFYYFYIVFYMTKKFGLTPVEVSLFFALVGLGLAIGTLLQPRILQPKFSLKWLIIADYGLLGLCALLTYLGRSQLYAWLVVIPLTAGSGAGYICMLTRFSLSVTKKQEGWVMGITGALNAVAAGSSAILVNPLSEINLGLPFLITVISIGIGLIISAFTPKIRVKKGESRSTISKMSR